MRDSKRVMNILVVLLTMTSGCADAISFLALGQVLTAAMTGNTVFLGLSIVHANGLKPLGYILALLSFMIGNAIGATILRTKRKVTGVNRMVIFGIGTELLALVLFGMLVTSLNFTNHFVLIFILAVAMGIQGSVARRIGVNGVPTTVITSTTTGLIESLIWNLHTYISMPRTMGAKEKPEVVSRSSIFVWTVDILTYGLGAACCGRLELTWNLSAIWLPIVIVLVVLILATIHQIVTDVV